ncbi:PREDICTED: myb-like protein X [Polistes canadensis]|uniref:myb-like protein X n=1 Tax=Polistes canadensis TaxID=91411 RepID=UPI000718E9B1|nr:PREDICTED: myb-like protein X [Polistes canadensis]
MAILFNKTLDYLIPRRRLLDDHNSYNYSKLKGTQRSNISINTNENNLATSTWSSDVTVNTEYFSNTPIIYEDSTRVRRKRNALEDENQSKFDEEHETDDKMNNKRSSSSSSSSSDNDDSGDQSSNVEKSESDELEDYNEESNDNETDDQENVVQSKDAKMKRESSDYDYAEDQDNKSSNDVRVKRDETKQTNDKTIVKLEDENPKNNELISSNKIDIDKSKESDEKKEDLSDEKKLTKEEEENGEYEKRVEEKIKRKIDSIKEEIKREIERKRRDREIEKNNAKFDEIQNKDNEEQENPNEEISNVDEKIISKRSSDVVVRPKRKMEKRRRRRGRVGRGGGRGGGGVRRRRRRRITSSNDNDKIMHRLEEIEGVDNLRDDDYRIAESIRESNIKKRFATEERSVKGESIRNNDISMNKSPVKKREKVRQMFIVKDDSDKRRRKKKKRKVNKNEEEERDLTFDPNLLRRNQRALDEKKSQSDLRALASSAKDSNRRLITDYNEAFGGLQSLRDNPNGALTRFKRIKRVLQNSRTSHKNKLSD